MADGRGRIVLVEDDPASREALRRVLEAEGYAVLAAADGGEALEHLLTAGPPALILTDLQMPGVDGWELRARTRADARLADVPIVVISSLAPDDGPALAGDGAGHLQKPVDVEALLVMVRRILG